MKRPRKRLKAPKDPRHVLSEQRPMRLSPFMIERADLAAQIVSERDHKIVTATELLRDGGNRYVDEILATHRAMPLVESPHERSAQPRRQIARRAEDPQIIAKVS